MCSCVFSHTGCRSPPDKRFRRSRPAVYHRLGHKRDRLCTRYTAKGVPCRRRACGALTYTRNRKRITLPAWSVSDTCPALCTAKGRTAVGGLPCTHRKGGGLCSARGVKPCLRSATAKGDGELGGLRRMVQKDAKPFCAFAPGSAVSPLIFSRQTTCGPQPPFQSPLYEIPWLAVSSGVLCPICLTGRHGKKNARKAYYGLYGHEKSLHRTL